MCSDVFCFVLRTTLRPGNHPFFFCWFQPQKNLVPKILVEWANNCRKRSSRTVFWGCYIFVFHIYIFLLQTVFHGTFFCLLSHFAPPPRRVSWPAQISSPCQPSPPGFAKEIHGGKGMPGKGAPAWGWGKGAAEETAKGVGARLPLLGGQEEESLTGVACPGALGWAHT